MDDNTNEMRSPNLAQG